MASGNGSRRPQPTSPEDQRQRSGDEGKDQTGQRHGELLVDLHPAAIGAVARVVQAVALPLDPPHQVAQIAQRAVGYALPVWWLQSGQRVAGRRQPVG